MSKRRSARASGPRIPAYSLHKARGLACCKVNGRRIYLGKYDSPESREAYARIVADLIAGRPVSKPPIGAGTPSSTARASTVRELTARYLQHAQGYYQRDGKPSSELGVVESALRRFETLFGDLPADEVGPLSLIAFQEKLAGEGLKRSTVNGASSRVRRMFRWAGALQILPASVAHGLDLVSELRPGRSAARESEPILPVADQVVDATLEHLGQVVGAMVRLQRLTGARPGEICSLRPCDVDRSEDVWVYRPATHKTQHHGRERVVFIGPQGQTVLAPFLERDEAAARHARRSDTRSRASESRTSSTASRRLVGLRSIPERPPSESP